MPLAPGTRFGAYEIVSMLGAGGMGEVYRARDTKLGREAAIKILPEQFANDRERIARFEREARTLASLNHPHIAQIYGLEQAGSSLALAMELVDGDDLAKRIAQGPVPIDDALAMARQVADALDAAHGQGIVHRDLKPANIKLRPDGTLKVLDFGLAKPVEGPAASSGATITSPAMSMPGVILGTAAYMAPEQAKGRPVDKRADIWAFGCVLYEMLTGQRAFAGEDVSETIASVLKTEPDLSGVPARVKPLLVSCLQKDPRNRLRDVADAWLLLEPSSRQPPPPAARSSSLVAWSIAALTAAAAIAMAVIHFGERPAAVAPIAFDIHPLEGATFGESYQTLSPDGRRLVYTMRDKAGTMHLWMRDVSQREPRRLTDTAGARSPFWSPDGRSVAFAVDAKLQRIDVDGGPARLLSEVGNNIGVGAWGPDGIILFGSRLGGPIYRVADTGGPAVAVTALDQSRSEGFHAMPLFLRDGKRFLYLRASADPKQQGIFVGSLDLAPDQQPMDMVVQTRLGAGYYAPPAGSSWLLFIENGNLISQEFDESRSALIGSPVLEAEGIGSGGSYPFFSVSSAGALAYRSGQAGGPNDLNLTWFGRGGQPQAQVIERGAYSSAKLSPDGTRIVGGLMRGGFAADIWLSDLTRGTMTRLTSDTAMDAFPIWSPDSSRILFTSLRPGGAGLYEKSVDSVEPERQVYQSRGGAAIPDGWSSDGRFVLFTQQTKETGFDLSLLELGPGPPKATPLLNSPFDEGFGVFSPDGRHFAYVSDESGRDEVYVRTFTPPGATAASGAGKWLVSSGGGQTPRWRRDGKELFYRHEGRVLSVPIDTARPSFTPGRPVELFSARGALVTQWDVAPDGQRFLMPLLPILDDDEPIRVTLNWRPGGRPTQ